MPAPSPAHLVVLVGGRQYGIPMSCVREVAPLRPPTAVPGAPGYIRGVVLFDDRPTPVIDPACFLSRPMLDLSPHSCLVFVTSGEHSVAGILIDDIVGLVDSPIEETRDSEPDGTTSPLLTSLYVTHEGQRVAVMHVPALMGDHHPHSVLVSSESGGTA